MLGKSLYDIRHSSHDLVNILFVGCGVFATQRFSAKEFLLEYRGEHISSVEGERRFASFQPGSFLYFYEIDKKKSVWYVPRYFMINVKCSTHVK